MSTITKATGFKTADGRMFSTLDEAAGHLYTRRIRDAIGKAGSSVFGVSTILAHSRELEVILREYNAELTALAASERNQQTSSERT